MAHVYITVDRDFDAGPMSEIGYKERVAYIYKVLRIHHVEHRSSLTSLYHI